MREARSYVCHVLAALIGLCVTVFLFQLFDRHPVVSLDAQHSYIRPNPAVAGQNVFITWTAAENRNCDGSVVPRVVDSAGRIFEYTHIPTVYHDLLTHGAETFTKTLTLPTGMAPGRARYEAVIERWCNWPQRLFWPMVDTPFPIWFDVVDQSPKANVP